MSDVLLKILTGTLVIIAFVLIVGLVSLIPLHVITIISGIYVAYLVGSIIWEWLNVK